MKLPEADAMLHVATLIETNIHCVPKHVTTLSHYNSDICESVLIISGKYVTEKVGR